MNKSMRRGGLVRYLHTNHFPSCLFLLTFILFPTYHSFSESRSSSLQAHRISIFYSWSDSWIRLHFRFNPIALSTLLLESVLVWLAKAWEPGPKSLVLQMAIHCLSLIRPIALNSSYFSPSSTTFTFVSFPWYLSKIATPLIMILPQPALPSQIIIPGAVIRFIPNSCNGKTFQVCHFLRELRGSVSSDSLTSTSFTFRWSPLLDLQASADLFQYG